jgi:hypothetical protein
MSSELQAGPTVQMILARRAAETGGSTARPVSLREEFPFFKFVLINFVWI